MYCGKENQDAVINFCLFSPFFISHSNVIHREICVKDFSGTTVPRILKFVTNVGYDLLYCAKVWFWFDFCFTALRHILGHFRRGQLT